MLKKMKRIRNIFLLLITVVTIFFVTCEEPFDPEITKYEDLIVVEGQITNVKKAHKIRITRSYEYSETKEEYIIGAKVTIIDDLGKVDSLKERKNGYYSTNSDFAGEIGRSYKLNIEYNSKIYESEMQKLEDVQDVDSVYWEFDNYTDSEGKSHKGIQIYVDSKDGLQGNKYYKWDYNETWKFQVPSMYEAYAGRQICWKSKESEEFLISSTSNLVTNKVEKFPLYFIDETESKIAMRYSVLVNLYPIKKETYSFYSQINEQKFSTGSLFEKTPVSITGNMKCITDPDEPVLGIFLVSGVKSKRIFIDQKELEKELSLNGNMSGCIEDAIDPEDINLIRTKENEGWIYITTVSSSSNVTRKIYVSSITCVDCTKGGYPNKAPDFWVE